MLSLKVNSISTYSAGNAVSKGKLDICESADSVGKDSLEDAKIFVNFGCPKPVRYGLDLLKRALCSGWYNTVSFKALKIQPTSVSLTRLRYLF